MSPLHAKSTVIVFFDAECPFCHKAVRYLLSIDRGEKLTFSPLRGETAQKIFTGPQKKLLHMDSLVLVEHPDSTERSFFVRSRAILRIYWIVGGKWKALGVFSFLPAWLGDFFYKIFAIHRHRFRLPMGKDPVPGDRFLP